jgi:hypothetical protein
MTPTGHIEQSNLAIQLHRGDFGEDYERVRQPFRVGTVDAYVSVPMSLDLDHVSLLGAGTPFPSPSSESIPLYGLYGDVDEEYAYASDGDDCEEEDKDEQHDADDKGEDEQNHDDGLVTQLPVTVVEEREGSDDHSEDEGPVIDDF